MIDRTLRRPTRLHKNARPGVMSMDEAGAQEHEAVLPVSIVMCMGVSSEVRMIAPAATVRDIPTALKWTFSLLQES